MCFFGKDIMFLDCILEWLLMVMSGLLEDFKPNLCWSSLRLIHFIGYAVSFIDFHTSSNLLEALIWFTDRRFDSLYWSGQHPKAGWNIQQGVVFQEVVLSTFCLKNCLLPLAIFSQRDQKQQKLELKKIQDKPIFRNEEMKGFTFTFIYTQLPIWTLHYMKRLFGHHHKDRPLVHKLMFISKNKEQPTKPVLIEEI